MGNGKPYKTVSWGKDPESETFSEITDAIFSASHGHGGDNI